MKKLNITRFRGSNLDETQFLPPPTCTSGSIRRSADQARQMRGKAEKSARFVARNTCNEDKKRPLEGKEAFVGRRGLDRPAVTNHPSPGSSGSPRIAFKHRLIRRHDKRRDKTSDPALGPWFRGMCGWIRVSPRWKHRVIKENRVPR